MQFQSVQNGISDLTFQVNLPMSRQCMDFVSWFGLRMQMYNNCTSTVETQYSGTSL